jgi:hypothetical protein
VPRTRAISLGVAAGLMMAVKPQFLVVAMVPEAYWALRHRRVRPLLAPEAIAVVATGLVYLLHFIVFPDIGRAYLALAVHMWSLYATFDDAWPLVVTPVRVAVVAVALGFAAMGPRPVRGDPQGELVGALVAFTIASFVIIYLVVQKAWPYHYEPALHGSILLISVAIAGTGVLATPTLRPGLLIAATLCFVFSTQLSPGLASIRLVPKLQQLIVEHSKPGDHIMMLTCGVPPTWPLLAQIDRRNASRYSDLTGEIPRFYPPTRPFAGYRSRDQVEAEERRFLDDLRDDAQRDRPGLLVVQQRACQDAPEGFDLWTYLNKVGFIDDVFGDYTKLGQIDDRTPVKQFSFMVLARTDHPAHE